MNVLYVSGARLNVFLGGEKMFFIKILKKMFGLQKKVRQKKLRLAMHSAKKCGCPLPLLLLALVAACCWCRGAVQQSRTI